MNSWTRSLAAVAALAFSNAASAQTYFLYSSEPGDFVGSGQTNTLTDAESFTVSSSQPSYVRVAYFGPDEWWSMDFSSGTGAPLEVGTYGYATRWPFNAPGTPGLSVFGNGNGCNMLEGRFVISELSITAGGEVEAFAVDFEQHCENADPALFGTVRYNSSAPPLTRRLVNASDIEASFFYVSEPGDFVGGGQTELLTDEDLVFSVFQSPSHVRFSLSDGFPNWSLVFDSGDNDVPLEVGTYLDATRYPFNAPGVPGLSVTGNGNGCNTLTGRFIVSELVLDEFDQVLKAAIDFEQHCEGGEAALFGSIRYRSNEPELIHRLMGDSFAVAYCFGESCPCGNDAELGGCRNSTGAGASLVVRGGGPSLEADDLELSATGLPPLKPAVLLSGAGAASWPLGAGTLCVGGGLLRLELLGSDEGGNAHFAGLPGLSAELGQPLQPGDARRYQVWYRDGGGPCGASFNLSSALEVPFTL